MIVSQALQERKSVRAYLDTDVMEKQIRKLLDLAKHAPSGVNTQPWKVAVLKGQSKEAMQEKLLDAFYSKRETKSDYQYYPLTWQAPYSNRRAACGLQLYQAVDIKKEDKEKRLAQWAANFRSFDAPVMLFFYMDSVMETGSFLDYGMFLQSFMLAAVEEGLATCAQGALAEYTDIVKAHLVLPEDTILLCGMALGYEDTSAPINGYRTPRLDVDAFASFHD